MHRLSVTLLGSAAFVLFAAMPAAAADLPGAILAPIPATTPAAVTVMTGAAEEAEWRRRCGWRGCWSPYRGRGRGIGTSDVLAGVLVIGGIAAIASAASNNRRDRVIERAPPPPRPVRGDSYRSDNRNTSQSSSGIDRAVDMCIDQVERGNTRIDSVDNASRGGDGWRVSGALERGGGWSCWIDNDGRVREIDLGGGYSSFEGEGSYAGDAPNFAVAGSGQLSDEVYLSARERLPDEPYQAAGSSLYEANGDTSYEATGNALADRPAEPLVDADLAPDAARPAYPGGPLPGEEGFEEAIASRGLATR